MSCVFCVRRLARGSSAQQLLCRYEVSIQSLLKAEASPLPSALSLAATPPSLPRALLCPHMFWVPSPFAGAVVIGKPGVLLFQRPGSMEREVILGPWRMVWEHSGGCWTDKNQASHGQEHADFQTHTQALMNVQCVVQDVLSNIQTGRCTRLHEHK